MFLVYILWQIKKCFHIPEDCIWIEDFMELKVV